MRAFFLTLLLALSATTALAIDITQFDDPVKQEQYLRLTKDQIKSLKPSTSDRVLSLLAVHFEASDHPSGYVTLTFSGDASIRLHVECIEAELTDLGSAWRARSKPQHPGAEPGADS